MMKTFFSSAKDAKKREDNPGERALTTAHELAACPGLFETYFAFLRVLRE